MPRHLLTRRTLLKDGLLATGAAFSTRAFALGATCSPTVKTALGTLRGECGAGVRVFRGVPFAAPPIDALRFRAPAKLTPWAGERDATRFAASAMQPGEQGVQHSEDCLYLNVWAPEGKGPFPVYIWIHGGGFTGGHAFESTYDGTQLAREGIVCVTVGYRLGVFGFLDVEPILGSSYAGSANNGLRDLVAALSWVQAHIANFGGDPTRVTVGGQSAGAKLTDMLMGIPAAKPLFAQALSESGGAERVWPHATAQEVGSGFASAFHTASSMAAQSIATAPAASLIAAQQKFIAQWPKHFPLRPEIDGDLLPRLPIETIAAGSTKGKRLLIGTNRDESAFFIGPHPQHDPTAADLGNLAQPAFAAIYARYAQLYPTMTDEQRRIRAVTAEEYWIPSIRVANAHVQAGGSAYMYRFDFAETRGRLADYAAHAEEVGMVWGKPHTNVGNDAAEAALGEQMHTAWSAFVRGQTPSAPGLPAWPAYDAAKRQTMILNEQSHVESRPQEQELRLWDGLL